MNLKDKGSEQLMSDMMFALKNLEHGSPHNIHLISVANTIRDELLSRLEQIESLSNENIRLHAQRFESGKMVAEAIKKAENLECCGNCSDSNCGHTYGYCDKWQSDNLKREERIIK